MFARIFDRVPHISNPIYCKINSERDEYYPESELHARLITRVNPIIVYCHTGDIPAVDSMVPVDGKSHKSLTHMREVQEGAKVIASEYDRVMSSLAWTLPVIRYNRFEHPQDYALNTVIEVLRAGEL